jgi:transposase, IS5 family
VIADRLFSLSDPDARPIRKGKPGRPTEFGYSLLLAEDEGGFVADHQLQQGNPPYAPRLVPSVERVVAVTGRAPRTVVGDRGFGTAANDQALEAPGIKHIGLQRTGHRCIEPEGAEEARRGGGPPALGKRPEQLEALNLGHVM